MEVICSYCGQLTNLVQGSEIYKVQNKPYSKKYFYYCKECDAYVGCHPGTKNPMGTVANRRLRKLRNSCHNSFDKIWKDKHLSRSQAYKWLAAELNIYPEQCHIAMSVNQKVFLAQSDRQSCLRKSKCDILQYI